MTVSITRRTLLRGAVGSALLAGTSITATSCSTGNSGSGGGAAIKTSLLPTFKDPGVVKPDLVSAHEGGLSAYLTYPATPPAVFDKPPLSGSKIKSMTSTYDPVAPGLKENPLWQNVNKLLGADLDIIYTPTADYKARFSTTVAGGDLPDTVAIPLPVQQLPAMLKAKFTDLSEYLGGDAVLDYPYLAAIPTASWKSCVINNALWAVPVPRPPVSGIAFLRADLIKAKGLPTQPKSFTEFSELLVGLTKESKGKWATADANGTLGLVTSALGIPGVWQESGGTFTANIGTEEYAQALADVKGLAAKGVFHPDGLSSTNNQRNDWFTNGAAPIVYAGYVGWSKFEMWGKDIDGFELAGMLPFDYDASTKALHARGNPAGTLTALKQADENRIKEILTYLNWLAAPFGTQEHLARVFGIEGTTFTLDGTDPILNSAGQNQRLVPFGFIADGPYPLYDAGQPKIAQARFDYQEKAMPLLAPDTTSGLYSETSSEKAAQLDIALNDARNEILAGRKPLSGWKDAVADWKSGGGDTIKAELEEAYADAQGA